MGVEPQLGAFTEGMGIDQYPPYLNVFEEYLNISLIFLQAVKENKIV